jgi:hypothetical protein
MTLPEGIPVVTLRESTFRAFMKRYDMILDATDDVTPLKYRLLYGQHSRRIFMVANDFASNRNGKAWWFFTGADVTLEKCGDHLVLGKTMWDSSAMRVKGATEDTGAPCHAGQEGAILYEIVIVNDDRGDSIPKEVFEMLYGCSG